MNRFRGTYWTLICFTVSLACSFFGNNSFRTPFSYLAWIPLVSILIVEVKAAFEAAERKFFADRLVFFGTGFFFLFKSDRQLTIVERQFKVFFAAAGGAKFQMIGIRGFMDIDGGKTKAFVLYRETLEELIDELGDAPMSVVVYFYECHTIAYLCWIILFYAEEGSNDIPVDLSGGDLAELTGRRRRQMTEEQVLPRTG